MVKICSLLKIKTSTHLGDVNPIHRIYEGVYLELCVGCWVQHLININSLHRTFQINIQGEKHEASEEFRWEDAPLREKKPVIPKRQNCDPCSQAPYRLLPGGGEIQLLSDIWKRSYLLLVCPTASSPLQFFLPAKGCLQLFASWPRGGRPGHSQLHQ